MRRALTIAFPHGSDVPVVIAGPEVPIQRQRDEFKQTRSAKEHPQFGKVTLYELDDTQSRSQRFTPPVKPAPAAEPVKADVPKSDKSKPKKS